MALRAFVARYELKKPIIAQSVTLGRPSFSWKMKNQQEFDLSSSAGADDDESALADELRGGATISAGHQLQPADQLSSAKGMEISFALISIDWFQFAPPSHPEMGYKKRRTAKSSALRRKQIGHFRLVYLWRISEEE